jgi:hypothetical protein
MRVTSFTSSHAQMGTTRTYEDFHKWLGGFSPLYAVMRIEKLCENGEALQ